MFVRVESEFQNIKKEKKNKNGAGNLIQIILINNKI